MLKPTQDKDLKNKLRDILYKHSRIAVSTDINLVHWIGDTTAESVLGEIMREIEKSGYYRETPPSKATLINSIKRDGETRAMILKDAQYLLKGKS